MAKPPKVTKVTISGDRFDNNIDGSTLASDIQSRGLIINGNDGNDTLKGGSGQDVLNGGGGDDVLIADESDLVGRSAGTTVYDGGTGTDTLDLSSISTAGSGIWIQASYGAKGFNFIRTDVTYNHGSLDIEPISYSATYGNNFKGIENFILGDGDDVIQLLNPTGNNVIEGRGGNDYLWANDGNDTVDGGSGDDLISGGWGNDVVTGGSGNDAFVFAGNLAGQYTFDTITDFDVRNGSGDTSFDEIWIWDGFTLDWDESRPDSLHAFIMQNGVAIGDVAFQGLTLADAANVVWRYVDLNTGDPYGGTP